MAKKLYHLYVVKPGDIPENERFYLITSKYCLLYTDRRPPKRNREIQDLSTLPELARNWIGSTIDQIREEYLREHEREILEKGKAFTERFEAELKAEREKLGAKEVTGDA